MMNLSLKSTAVLPETGLREEHLSFPGPRGVLRGILSRPPEGASCRGGIVFSHGWSGNRCGPADLIRTLSRHLAAAGFVCLRFDFSGRGESDGAGLETSLLTMGEDLTAAVDCFRKQTGIDAPAVCGLCSGGNVAVGSLKRLSSLRCLLLLSVYPFSDGDCFQRDAHRTWHFLRVYIRKACCPENWRRLLQGQASVKNVLNVLFGHWLNRKRNQVKESGGAAPGKSSRAARQESRSTSSAGPAPEKHLACLRPELPVLMVYGGADPDAAAAHRYFSDYAERHGLPMEFRSVEQANHNFSSAAWRRELEKILKDFLKAGQGV